MGVLKYKKQCPKCAENGRDNGKDNLAIYQDNSAYCWACGYTIPSGDKNYKEEEEQYIPTMSKNKITKIEYTAIKENTSLKGKGYRGIKDEVYELYGVRHEYDQSTGEVIRQFYPTTMDYKLVGYKTRIHPKDFSKPIGVTGKECELFGQIRFKDTGSSYVLIVGGEIDAMSAYQILRDNQISRGQGEWPPVACVSATTGEPTTAGQCKAQYAWLDSFEKIYVCLDNDDAGREAQEKLVDILPRGKVYTVPIQLKDPNKYIELKREKEFIGAFFSAKKYVPNGITTSADLEDKMREHLSIERLSLPPYQKKLQEALRGGIPAGYIVNLISASGSGKSTVVDSMLLHWIMNANRKVGIVSLEASEGEYGVNLSSSYCGFKVNLLETVEERLKWLDDDKNKQLRHNLWFDENGEPRFYLLDSDIDNLKTKVEYLVRSLDCKIIVLDPLQDILDTMDKEEHAKFMTWQKNLVKREKINIINVNHVRKSSQGEKANSRGADIEEENTHGSSTIIKSGAINIIFNRDKQAEDPIERNTLYVKLAKARGVGTTGPCGVWYYDNATHTLHDKEEYFEQRRHIL